MKKIVKIGLTLLCVLIVVAAALGIYAYRVANTGFAIDKEISIQIDSTKDYDKLLADLKEKAKVESVDNFDLVAGLMQYKDNLRTGNYVIKPDMNIVDVIRNLRSGAQTPVRITFNNIRTKDDLCERLAEQLMITADDLKRKLNDENFCESLGFTTQTIVAMFIPNTYEFYWDISLDKFLSRMNKEYVKFWTDDRKSKAAAIGLTPVEVSTLAAIVEEECTYSDEYPIVAGLYLNRLKKGQKLQADPTVKFAVGDFSLKRILYAHLEVDSPYNTYKYEGLPPGPIRVPSIKGIDGVLNYTKHDYLYMCAKEDFSGYHNFAKTLAQHNINAAKYRAELNRRGIR
ncbi:endolytic transglycosylase MltG [Dysgonomonas massiliensis]|uniref:endolytic transglycosylase MltG n=1 Tax=Dysgonomonas massiliensis TaxID=2040292 RepID=UPI000C766837|nr:endolytic transglycosylase MltG [Dysgonomonas massiliensis]